MRVRPDRVRHTTRRRVPTVAVALGTLALGLIGCGSDEDGTGSSSAGVEETNPTAESTAVDSASSAAESTAPEPASGGDADGEFVLLDLDPCSALTRAEMEAAVGDPVERGGFGDDLPGRCTHSIGGDVGAGVVGVGLEDPLVCAAIKRAIDAGGTATGRVVDVGEGGIVARDGGTIQFLVGGGCVSIGASNSGVGLDEATMLDLANAAAGRVG